MAREHSVGQIWPWDGERVYEQGIVQGKCTFRQQRHSEDWKQTVRGSFPTYCQNSVHSLRSVTKYARTLPDLSALQMRVSHLRPDTLSDARGDRWLLPPEQQEDKCLTWGRVPPLAALPRPGSFLHATARAHVAHPISSECVYASHLCRGRLWAEHEQAVFSDTRHSGREGLEKETTQPAVKNYSAALSCWCSHKTRGPEQKICIWRKQTNLWPRGVPCFW